MSSSEWTESLVTERVAQLDAITQRRNALLREMYHMIQKKHDVGVLLVLDAVGGGYNGVEDDGLKQFMDRFDLSKDQESGMIFNLSDGELSVPFPSEVDFTGEPAPPEPDIDSPMSEPPASPTRTKSPAQKEEDEEAEINDVVEAVVQVELPTSDPSTPSPQQPREVEEKKEEEEEEEEEIKAQQAKAEAEVEIEAEVEEEEQPASFSDHVVSAPPSSPRPPSPPASASTHYSPAPLRQTSRPRSSHIPSPSPEPVSVQPITDVTEASSEPMEDIREESPQLILPASSPVFHETTEIHIQEEDTSIDVMAETALAPSPVRELPPRPMVIHTAVDVASFQPSLLIPTPTSPAPALPDFSFDDGESETLEEPVQPTTAVEIQHHHFNPDYNLPPLKALPPEYLRKGKSKQKKKDKEKTDAKGGKEEWAPLGFTKWGAVIRANPIHRKVSRSTKCLSTKDWSVAITELRLLRTLERVESLESIAKWSYRQPKKQRNLGGMTKTHWDYLLDEMKWMRVDFREERRWKYALAFNISTAVLEWHEAGTHEERVKLGICMHWKPPRATDSAPSSSQQRRQQQDMEVDNEEVAGEQCDKEHAYSDQESGDDDDEGEVEQRDIVDALETRSALEEVLEGCGSRSGSGESGESSRRQSTGPDSVLRPKVEDVEDSTALENVNGAWQGEADAMDVDDAQPREDEGNKANNGNAERAQSTKQEVVDLAGLKPDSSDPVLGSQTGSESQSSTLPVASSSKSVLKSNLYAPLRERIAYSEDNKLFVDNDDLDLVKALSELTTEDSPPPTPDLEAARSLDLSDLFPDLQVLGMPEVASSKPKKRADKKSERDDNRRVDDSGYTKIAPMGRFMLCKPTLLGPLQPVRRWKNGRWLPPEEPAVTEAESSSSKIMDDQLSALFDGLKPQGIGGALVPHPPKDSRKRLDHAWSPAEDDLLKSFVDKYPCNWTLVADSFNSMRVTISIDKRTPWECFERWNLKLGGKPSGGPGHADVTSPAGVDGTPPPATPTASTPTHQVQMTTRGVKRLANINFSQGQATGAGATGVSVSSDTIKRRRHSLMYETIRKTAKKREATQKAASMNQRKPPNIHDTHGQYNKMPKLTPAELSRMKAEKESRDQQEMIMARRRHEELARQQLLRAQQPPVTAAASVQPGQQQPQVQQPQQSQQPQPQQPQQPQTGNGAARPATQPPQPSPQLRAQTAVPQVNISQQQRMPTPMSATAARMSPQQILQVQAAQARVNAITSVTQSQAQVHAQLQAQVQVQVQAQGTPQAVLNNLPAGISVAQQASPPRTALTPSNAGVAASPRPPSAQPQLPMPSPQIPGNTVPRPTSSIAAHYLPVVPTGQHFTQEQMDQALRLSSLMQRTTMSQTQQGGQYPSQN